MFCFDPNCITLGRFLEHNFKLINSSLIAFSEFSNLVFSLTICFRFLHTITSFLIILITIFFVLFFLFVSLTFFPFIYKFIFLFNILDFSFNFLVPSFILMPPSSSSSIFSPSSATLISSQLLSSHLPFNLLFLLFILPFLQLPFPLSS